MDTLAPSAATARPFRWLNCGWRLVHRCADLFVGMAVLYLLLAILLTRVPFLGPLLLVLVTPALAAGAWLATHDAAHAGANPMDATGAPIEAAHGVRTRLTRHLLQPSQALLRALGDERRMLATIILCVVCLGVVMAVKITEYVLVGGSMLSALQSPEVMTWLRPSTVVGMVIVSVLSVLAAMTLLFVVPATVFGNIDALTALGRSFVACAQNFFTILLFFGLFLAAYLALVAAFGVSGFLGYFATFTLGPIVLTNYLGATYCCYRDIFGGDQAITPEGV